MRQTIHDIQREVDDLENHSRMPNFIVYGVQEGNEETTEVLEREVSKNIFWDIFEQLDIAKKKIIVSTGNHPIKPGR